MIFFDTPAAFALLNNRDEFHGTALNSLQTIDTDGETLLTHNYVILETAALLQRRIGLAAAITFQRDALSHLKIHWVNETDHERAVERWLERDTRRLNLVDCMSFVVMERYDCTTAFAYDSDFESEGFQLIG